MDLHGTEEPELKNIDTKSVILAPFNSTRSHVSSLHSSIEEILFQKQEVLRLNAKCRDADRQYEFNNNGLLDNGVYNKFVKKKNEEVERAEEGKLEGSLESVNTEDIEKEKLK